MMSLALVVAAGVVVCAALVIGVVVWRRRRLAAALAESIAIGDDVVLSGGIAGRVMGIDGAWIRLRLGRERSCQTVTALRSAVVARWEAER